MEPLVTITMPVYNGLPLIKASIESIKQQTYTNWECIIIDDGSTDGTSEYLDTLNDERFLVSHQPNGGRAVARQKALELARGKYIAMLDAEDLYHPEKIEKQVRILEEKPDISIVTTAMCSFGTNTDKLHVRGAFTDEEVVFNGRNHPTHAPSMMRAEIAKKCSYNPMLRLGEDQDFLEKYLNIGDKYLRMADVYYYYSELDSVSKHKIRRSYYLYIIKYFKEKKYRMSAIFLIKYIYSLTVFPFQSLDSILAKRGRQPTEDQRLEFEKYCRTIIGRTITKQEVNKAFTSDL